ncbi:P [Farmington virus]|uniref:P n=1 Tax=Farmington virus TaxID=1027468 RepID=UPI000387ABA1|nr:P [Farmington virus] [Farmington virus]AGN91188.1 P [Farmington virus] [Farmington virus]
MEDYLSSLEAARELVRTELEPKRNLIASLESDDPDPVIAPAVKPKHPKPCLSTKEEDHLPSLRLLFGAKRDTSVGVEQTLHKRLCACLDGYLTMTKKEANAFKAAAEAAALAVMDIKMEHQRQDLEDLTAAIPRIEFKLNAILENNKEIAKAVTAAKEMEREMSWGESAASSLKSVTLDESFRGPEELSESFGIRYKVRTWNEFKKALETSIVDLRPSPVSFRELRTMWLSLDTSFRLIGFAFIPTCERLETKAKCKETRTLLPLAESIMRRWDLRDPTILEKACVVMMIRGNEIASLNQVKDVLPTTIRGWKIAY